MNRTAVRYIGFVMLVGWMGAAPIRAQLEVRTIPAEGQAARAKREPLRQVSASNPHAQEVIQLARDLRRQYSEIFEVMLSLPTDYSRLNVRIARYYQTYRRYYAAVAKYRTEEAKWVEIEVIVQNMGPGVGDSGTLGGARVEISRGRKSRGALTDARGRVKLGKLIHNQKYSYKVTKEGYGEEKGEFTALGGDHTLLVQLKPVGTSLTLRIACNSIDAPPPSGPGDRLDEGHPFLGWAPADQTGVDELTPLPGARVTLWSTTEPIAGDEVTAYLERTPPYAEVTSNRRGQIHLESVPAGAYWVRVQLDGFETQYDSFGVSGDPESPQEPHPIVMRRPAQDYFTQDSTGNWIPTEGSTLDDPFTTN